jgi:hypothetical protein
MFRTPACLDSRSGRNEHAFCLKEDKSGLNTDVENIEGLMFRGVDFEIAIPEIASATFACIPWCSLRPPAFGFRAGFLSLPDLNI